MSRSRPLNCELCNKPVDSADLVVAVEVVEQRDRAGKIVATHDGYQAAFHERCWTDLQARRIYSARTYRRPRPSR